MRKCLTGVLIASALAAGGCAGPRTTQEIWPLYRPGEFARAAGGRDMYVVLRGSPFAMDTAQFEHLVLSNMQGQNWGQRTNFTTKPVNYDPGYKVVLLFNGPPVNGGDLCRNPGAIPFRTGPQPELHIQAAHCRFDQWQTTVQGWLKGDANGVDPQALAGLIRQVTAELFPPYNSNDARRDSNRLRITP